MDINRCITDKAKEWFPYPSSALCCAASGYGGEILGQNEVTTAITVTASGSPFQWMDTKETVLIAGSLATVAELITVVSVGLKIYYGIPLDPWEATEAVMGLPATFVSFRQLPEYLMHKRRQQ